MYKYRLAATALKVFSVNELTRKTYRALGNVLGGKQRGSSVQSHYFSRAEGNLRAIEECGAIADGMQLVELGTGWVHWEAMFTRLFYDVKIKLFDVWDNRQFQGFLHYVGELRHRLASEIKRDPEAIKKAEALLDRVLETKSFEEAYALLGFEYIIEPTGSLRAIEDGSVDLVISSDVMEHVPRDAVPALCADLKRILRPGGHVSQQIVYVDHLTIYDRAVHPKNYLRYSDRQWRWWLQNDVQYINLLQPSDFQKAFTSNGFEIVNVENVQLCDSSKLKIDERFRHYPREELDVAVDRLIVKTPS
ncbi:Class I SAM-dependent methyltransferase [Novosphingobium lubricantis]|jgi:SAM-dependent methyltransferase